MISLISTLIGFLTSGLPYVMKLFQAKQDQAHELALAQLQVQAQASSAAAHLEEVRIQGLIQESIAELKPADAPLMPSLPTTGIKWIDAIDALLTAFADFSISMTRPVITWVNNGAFWCLVALELWLIVAPSSAPLTPFQGALLTTSPLIEGVLATYASINGYWFGSRSWEKLLGRKQ